MPYLPEAFDRAAESNASSLALIEESNGWTFAQLADESNRIATVIKEQVKGDTVGVLLLNSQKYIATMLGIWKAGKTAVPLNYHLPDAELAFIIKDSGMSGLVSSQAFNQPLAAIKPLFGDKGLILMADDPAFLAPAANSVQFRYRDPALYLYTSAQQENPKEWFSRTIICSRMWSHVRRRETLIIVTLSSAYCRSFTPTRSPARFFCRS